MSDYTPTTEEVRDSFMHESLYIDEYRPAFDRWLAAHDAEVRADEREKAKRRVFLASMQAGIHAAGCSCPIVSGCFCHVSILAAAAARGESEQK